MSGMRTLLLLVLFAVAGLDGAAWAADRLARFAAHTPTSAHTVNHAAFAVLLDRYRESADDGIPRVRYRHLAEEGAPALDAYLAHLSRVDVAVLDRPEQLAFWLNLFNATVLDVVATNYPVTSIRAIDLDPRDVVEGPWTAARATVRGVRLSLADIEDGILERHWRDPRIRYGLHRGSLGCPNLPPEPFTGARIDAQLDRAAMAYVNHPRGVTIDGDRLVVSSLYRWFLNDFGGSERGVLRHLMAYADPERAMRLQGFDGIDADRYDWRLNDR